MTDEAALRTRIAGEVRFDSGTRASGYNLDALLPERGFDLERAGSFGFDKAHYKVSLDIGERVLIPAVLPRRRYSVHRRWLQLPRADRALGGGRASSPSTAAKEIKGDYRGKDTADDVLANRDDLADRFVRGRPHHVGLLAAADQVRLVQLSCTCL